jgi:hypothetical protein
MLSRTTVFGGHKHAKKKATISKILEPRHGGVAARSAVARSRTVGTGGRRVDTWCHAQQGSPVSQNQERSHRFSLALERPGVSMDRDIGGTGIAPLE